MSEPNESGAQEHTIPSLTEKWLSRGLVIRVLAYMVGAHVFAGFLFLLFAAGAHHSH